MRLFRDFLAEQSDPDRFYRALAANSIDQLSGYVDLSGGTVLDVGGGPGGRARARYVRKHGHEPKNRYGETLFGHSVAAALGWLQADPSCVPVAVFPRYHPWWARWVIRVPGLREVASWNVAAVLRRR